jgi:hypothetical protein
MFSKKRWVCKDGDVVKSSIECFIDNWLTRNGVKHIYERSIVIGGRYRTDFYCFNFEIFIEYWGLTGNIEYDRKRMLKLDVYEENKLKLFSIFPSDDVEEILNQTFKTMKSILSSKDTLKRWLERKKHLTYETILALHQMKMLDEYGDMLSSWLEYKASKRDTTSKIELRNVRALLKPTQKTE